MTPIKPAARFLMCRPEHFAVSYAINPWMDPPAWARDGSLHSAAAHREWNGLYRKLTEHGAAVDLVPPARACPISCSPPTPRSCSTARCCWRASGILSARPKSRISRPRSRR